MQYNNTQRNGGFGSQFRNFVTSYGRDYMSSYRSVGRDYRFFGSGQINNVKPQIQIQPNSQILNNQIQSKYKTQIQYNSKKKSTVPYRVQLQRQTNFVTPQRPRQINISSKPQNNSNIRMTRGIRS